LLKEIPVSLEDIISNKVFSLRVVFLSPQHTQNRHTDMKRWIGIIFLILAIALFIIYFFLPSSGKLVVNRNIKSSNEGIYRSMINQQVWNKWFAKDIIVTKPLHNSAEITIMAGDQKATGNILLVPATPDSTKVYWQAELLNYNRFTGYSALKDLYSRINVALDSLKAFTEITKNVYGIDLKYKLTKDTFMLSQRFTTKAYPEINDIYPYINGLKKKITAMNASPAGDPMLNITPTDSGYYKCMVAVPVNKKLNSPGFVEMLSRRLFLTTEVKGGSYTIRHANKMMEQYISDYQRTLMAIPFEYMVTDRSAEPDTTKWITEIYAPVY
jgi:hypothetical protein